MSKGWLRRAWRWLTSFEPLSRSDAAGLFGFVSGLCGWMIGAPSLLSHIGALASGMCLGQTLRDRMQRAHERRIAQLDRDHRAAMAEIAMMDFEALVLLSKQQPGAVLEMRRCPRCRRITYNPNDIKEGYCVECHEWT